MSGSSGLDFGRLLTEETLTIRKRSIADNLQISVRVKGTEDASIPLRVFKSDSNTWLALDQPYAMSMEKQEEFLHLGIDRSNLTREWSGLLQLVTSAGTEDDGVRFEIPVTVGTSDITGLWVGIVEVNEVGHVGSDNRDPCAVSDPFSFRLILHVDANNVTSLVSRVLEGRSCVLHVRLWRDPPVQLHIQWLLFRRRGRLPSVDCRRDSQGGQLPVRRQLGLERWGHCQYCCAISDRNESLHNHREHRVQRRWGDLLQR